MRQNIPRTLEQSNIQFSRAINLDGITRVTNCVRKRYKNALKTIKLPVLSNSANIKHLKMSGNEYIHYINMYIFKLCL